MNKKDLLRLITDPSVFPHICSLLVSLDVITHFREEEEALTRLILTPKGEKLIEKTRALPNLVFIGRYRALFPSKKKGDAKLVAENLAWLINTYGVSEAQILDATERYILTLDDPKYCQPADYFIYKTLPNRAVRNTIIEFLNKNKEEEEEGHAFYGQEVV